jgi:hypothetical protein
MRDLARDGAQLSKQRVLIDRALQPEKEDGVEGDQSPVDRCCRKSLESFAEQ